MNRKTAAFLISAGLMLFFGNKSVFASELPDKWTDCGTDMSCAKKIAGFDFPLNIKKHKIKATDNFIEILMPLNKLRTAELRKTKGTPFADISSCDKDYYLKSELELTKDEVLFTQGNDKRIYVVNFWLNGYDYSIYCKRGMTSADVISVYELIKNSAD